MTENRLPFSVRYAGPATANNLIDVRDLAKSLVGLNRSLDNITREAFPGAQTKLEVSAQFRRGSAIADLVLTVLPPVTSVTTPIVAPLIPEARQVIDLLKDVVALYKMFRGHHAPEASLTPGQEGKVNVTFNNSQISVAAGAIHIYNGGNLQKSLAESFSPIGDGKIEQIELLSKEGTPLVDVRSADMPSFEFQRESDSAGMIQNYPHTIVSIKQISLEGEIRWTLSWGDSSFSAKIEDQDFLAKVRTRTYTFGYGEQLVVDLQMAMPPGKKPQWSVIKVHHFVSPQVQSELFT